VLLGGPRKRLLKVSWMQLLSGHGWWDVGPGGCEYFKLLLGGLAIRIANHLESNKHCFLL
jgi:hypothetical protein